MTPIPVPYNAADWAWLNDAAPELSEISFNSQRFINAAQSWRGWTYASDGMRIHVVKKQMIGVYPIVRWADFLDPRKIRKAEVELDQEKCLILDPDDRLFRLRFDPRAALRAVLALDALTPNGDLSEMTTLVVIVYPGHIGTDTDDLRFAMSVRGVASAWDEMPCAIERGEYLFWPAAMIPLTPQFLIDALRGFTGESAELIVADQRIQIEDAERIALIQTQVQGVQNFANDEKVCEWLGSAPARHYRRADLEPILDGLDARGHFATPADFTRRADTS